MASTRAFLTDESLGSEQDVAQPAKDNERWRRWTRRATALDGGALALMPSSESTRAASSSSLATSITRRAASRFPKKSAIGCPVKWHVTH